MTSDDSASDRVVAALPPERLAPYHDATHGDGAAALRLYEWNIAASGAFYEALGIVEITVRNALNRMLTTFLGSDRGAWYDDQSGILSVHAQEDIARAKVRIQRQGHDETAGRVVAELSFGFWKFLLARRYEATLWTPCLRHAFPNLHPQRRATAFEAMDKLHTLRNRVAHYEPIHTRDLQSDMLRIYRLLDWIDPEVRSWAADLSRIGVVLQKRP